MMHELRLLHNFALEISIETISKHFIHLEKMNYFLISPLKKMHAIISKNQRIKKSKK